MKKITVILLSVLLILNCTACGGKKDNPTDGKVKIIIGDKPATTRGIDKWLTDRIDSFKKNNPDIIVENIIDPNSFDPTRQVSSALNNLMSPDAATVMRLGGSNYLRSVHYLGLTDDWTDYIKDYDDYSEFNSSILESFKMNGELAGFPGSNEIIMLGFNKSILKHCGVSEEEAKAVETWEQYKTISARLTKNSSQQINTPKGLKTVNNISGAAYWFKDFYLSFGFWAMSNGFDFAVQNANGSIDLNFDSQSSVETFEFLKSLYDPTNKIDLLDAYLGLEDFYYSNVYDYRVGSFFYYPSWGAPWYKPEEVILIPIPKGPSSTLENAKTPSFAAGYVLNKKATSEQKKAAAKYMMYVYGVEGWKDRYKFAEENAIRYYDLSSFSSIPLETVFNRESDKQWLEAISNAYSNLYVQTLNKDSYTTTLNKYIPDIVTNYKNCSVDSATLKKYLKALENTEYIEWVNDYNNNISK